MGRPQRKRWRQGGAELGEDVAGEAGRERGWGGERRHGGGGPERGVQEGMLDMLNLWLVGATAGAGIGKGAVCRAQRRSVVEARKTERLEAATPHGP